MSDDAEILATITPSAPRRLLGIITLCIVGGVLIYFGLTHAPATLLMKAALVLGGGVVLALAEVMRKATSFRLELTRTELRDSGGHVVAPVDQIVRIDRSAFAFKPSNGFLLRLAEPNPKGHHWAPGLWWRVGRRVGVGGITSASEAKATADVILRLMADRVIGGDGSKE